MTKVNDNLIRNDIDWNAQYFCAVDQKYKFYGVNKPILSKYSFENYARHI